MIGGRGAALEHQECDLFSRPCWVLLLWPRRMLQQSLQGIEKAPKVSTSGYQRSKGKGTAVARLPGRTRLLPLAMRAVVQRVKHASVEVDGQTISSIGPGLLCLIGIKTGDTQADAAFICKKILKTRAFGSENGRGWDTDVQGLGGEILLVSQFTLYGRLNKSKPDFSKAMKPQEARTFYADFVELVRKEYTADKVKDGAFGEMMDVSLCNDGPVTFIVDSDST